MLLTLFGCSRSPVCFQPCPQLKNRASFCPLPIISAPLSPSPSPATLSLPPTTLSLSLSHSPRRKKTPIRCLPAVRGVFTRSHAFSTHTPRTSRLFPLAIDPRRVSGGRGEKFSAKAGREEYKSSSGARQLAGRGGVSVCRGIFEGLFWHPETGVKYINTQRWSVYLLFSPPATELRGREASSLRHCVPRACCGGCRLRWALYESRILTV